MSAVRPLLAAQPRSLRPAGWAAAVLAAASALPNALAGRLRAGRARRVLAALTDRQLRDAGIDLTAAGRGKAAAVRFDPNLPHQS